MMLSNRRVVAATLLAHNETKSLPKQAPRTIPVFPALSSDTFVDLSFRGQWIEFLARTLARVAVA